MFGTSVSASGCVFERTSAGTTGGAIFALETATAVSSRFRGTAATLLEWDLVQGGGAIATSVAGAATSAISATDCVFDSCASTQARCRAGGEPSAALMSYASTARSGVASDVPAKPRTPRRGGEARCSRGTLRSQGARS